MLATTARRWPGSYAWGADWPQEMIEEALSRIGSHRRRHMTHHFGQHDFGQHDFGQHDFGQHDFGQHDFGQHDFGQHDFGRHDFGRHDFGRHGGQGPGSGHGRRGFGGPPFAWAWGAGPGRRSRRGDVRVAVLTLLSEEPMHGYQIITELTERSGGAWRPSPGSVYPTLQQLEDERLVSVSEKEGRRTYALTDAGRAEVARLAKDRRAPWEEMAEGAAAGGRLRTTAFQVMAAAMQVAMAGSEQQAARAERILGRTRRDLYRLLAEDDGAGDETADETGAGSGDRTGGGGEGAAR